MFLPFVLLKPELKRKRKEIQKGTWFCHLFVTFLLMENDKFNPATLAWGILPRWPSAYVHTVYTCFPENRGTQKMDGL